MKKLTALAQLLKFKLVSSFEATYINSSFLNNFRYLVSRIFSLRSYIQIHLLAIRIVHFVRCAQIDLFLIVLQNKEGTKQADWRTFNFVAVLSRFDGYAKFLYKYEIFSTDWTT